MFSVEPWKHRVQQTWSHWLALTGLGFGQSVRMAAIVILLLLSLVLATRALTHQTHADTVTFQVREDPTHWLGFAAVQTLWDRAPPQQVFFIPHADMPYWFLLSTDRYQQSDRKSIEISNRYLKTLRCWVGEGQDFQELASIDEGRGVSAQRARGGWMINLKDYSPYVDIICQMTVRAPGDLSVLLWENEALIQEIADFESRKGFVEGSLCLLILLALTVAIATRSLNDLLYAAWLITNYRFGAWLGGWDTHWLGFLITDAWLDIVRMLTLSGLYVVSVVLFGRLTNLHRGNSLWSFFWRCTRLVSFIMVVVIPFAPFDVYLQVLQSLLCASMLLAGLIAYRRMHWSFFACVAIYTFAIGLGLLTDSAWSQSLSMINLDHLRHWMSVGIPFLASILSLLSIIHSMRYSQAQRDAAYVEIAVAKDKLQRMFDMSPLAMFAVDRQGNLVKSNQHFMDNFLDMSGQPVFECVKAASLMTLFHVEAAGDQKALQRLFKEPQQDGRYRWFELTFAVDQDRATGILREVTEQKDREFALHFQATHDRLTGALNRRGFEERLVDAIALEQSHVVLAHFDLRRFRYINDTYGSALADEVLKAVYRELFKYFGRLGEIARLQADSFILLVDIRYIDEALRSCERMIQTLRTSPVSCDHKQIFLDLKASILECPGLTSVQEVMDAIDHCQREAKLIRQRHPSTEIVRFDLARMKHALEQIRLVARIGMQELPDNLVLLVQPILSLHAPSQHLHGEILLRARDREGQIGSAASIIDACMSQGRSSLLDYWVLISTLQFIDANLTRMPNLGYLSVNVTPSSLNDDYFIADALALFSQYPQAASRLCLEVTEVGALFNVQGVRAFIEKVRTMGVKIALDDFGAGYSNFRYAIDLSVDIIKIDGSIIVDVCRSSESMAVTKAVVSLAHDLGCFCVAEWVESDLTLTTLAQIRVDFVQGYLISRPIPMDQFLDHNHSAEFIADSDVRTLVDSCALRGRRS